MLRSVDSLPADKQAIVRNNGGGHYNHTLFWELMSPAGGGAPEGALAEEIRERHSEGDEPTSEEREFLDAERVPLESDEGQDRSDEARGTPTY